MAIIPGQLREPNDANADRQGGGAQYVYARKVEASVAYTRAGTRYVDTIAAGATAILYGSSPASPIADMTLDRHIVFITPANGGAATMYVATEAAWPGIAASVDVIGLDLWDWQGRHPFPPGFGTATAVPSTPAQPHNGQSISGGVRAGVLDSHSISGGAMSSGMSTCWSTIPGRHLAQYAAGYVRVPFGPSANMAIWTAQGGAGAQHQVYLTPSLHLVLYSAYNGQSGSLDLGPINANDETWFYAMVGGGAMPSYGFSLVGQITSTSRGLQTLQTGGVSNSLLTSGNSYGPAAAQQAWGYDVTTAGLLAFPNSSGWELSKFLSHTYTDTTVIISAPGSDTDVEAILSDDVWLCREPVGAVSSITGYRGNVMTAAPQGCTVNADGPYV